MIAALLAAGCPRADLPSPLGRDEALWSVTVLTASGPRSIEARYELRTEHLRADRWRISTLATRGTWSDSDGTWSFDSALPSPADPWPLTLQHLVGSVPAVVEVDRGRPVALVDPDAWRIEARSAVYSAPLPSEAAASGELLVDPEGLVADLGRTFPGLPPDEGPWVRSDRIEGLEVVRREDCTRTEAGFSCEGEVDGAKRGNVALFEVTVSTEIALDERGVRSTVSRYDGTLLVGGPSGVSDRPIAGIRTVERR